MRRILLTTLFMGLSPIAYAQMDAPRQPATPAPATATATSSRPAAGTGENCGTPDDFKPCPPLPRRNLPYYPANKH